MIKRKEETDILSWPMKKRANELTFPRRFMHEGERIYITQYKLSWPNGIEEQRYDSSENSVGKVTRTKGADIPSEHTLAHRK